MDQMDVQGRLAAHSLLTSLALALSIRSHADPVDSLKEVVESMMGSSEVARKAMPENAAFEDANSFVAAFNSELEQLQSLTTAMLASMVTERGQTTQGSNAD